MKYCCCCISLRAGTVTMGVLSLIGSIAGIIMITPAIASIPVAHDEIFHPAHFPSSFDGSVVVYDPANQVFTTNRSNRIIGDTIAVLALVYLIVTALTSALMIFGAIRRVSQCVFPWLALTFAIIVYLPCAVVAVTIMTTASQARTESLISLACTALGTVVNFFIWLAVFSYYQELVGNESQHRTQAHIGKIIAPPPVYATYIQ